MAKKITDPEFKIFEFHEEIREVLDDPSESSNYHED